MFSLAFVAINDEEYVTRIPDVHSYEIYDCRILQ